MSKKDYTHFTIVLDASFSMVHLKDAILKGLNGFLASQYKIGMATLTLMLFDATLDYNSRFVDLGDAKVLGPDRYVPRNQSAVLDALATAVADTQEDLADLSEDERPESVILILISDGIEQASSNFTRRAVDLAVSERWAKDSWEFIFISPNRNAKPIAEKIGIHPNSALHFNPTEPGVLLAFQSVNQVVSDYRAIKTESCNFTQEMEAQQSALTG